MVLAIVTKTELIKVRLSLDVRKANGIIVKDNYLIPFIVHIFSRFLQVTFIIRLDPNIADYFQQIFQEENHLHGSRALALSVCTWIIILFNTVQ